jgi:ABC-type transporter MlaC component
MKPEFRIKQNEKGKFEVYYVEVKGSSYFTKNKEVLKPFITYAGLEIVYPFSKIETAIEEMKAEIIKQTELL